MVLIGVPVNRHRYLLRRLSLIDMHARTSAPLSADYGVPQRACPSP